MKKLIVALFLFGQLALQAQNYYADLQLKMVEAYQRKNFIEASKIGNQILIVNPENIDVNVNLTASLIFLNRLDEAKKYNNVVLILDPSSTAGLTAKAYLMAAAGNLESAKQVLIEAIRFSKDFNISEDLKEMQEIGKAVQRESVFQELASWYERTAPSVKERSVSLVQICNIYNQLLGKPEDLMKRARELSAELFAAGKPELAVLAYSYASQWLRNTGLRSEAETILREGYLAMKQKGFGNNHYILSNVIASLMALTIDRNDLETAKLYGEEFMANVGKSPLPSIDVDGLINISSAYSAMRKIDSEQSLKYGIAAYDLAIRSNYISGIARAANAIAVASIDFYSSESTNRGLRYAEYGYKIADEYELEIKGSLLSNLALLYWSTGNEGKQKCLSILRHQSNKAKTEKRYDQASLYLNNLGAMYYASGLLDESISFFEESIALAEFGPQYSDPKDRLAFYDQQMSANQWLISCYAKKGNAEKTFEAMERGRARVFNERLSQQPLAPPLISDLQNLLKPDEACLMYHVQSGYEVIILTVTKKYAYVLYHEDPRFIGDIRENRLSKRGNGPPPTANNSTSKGFEWISLGHQRTQVYRSYEKESVAPRTEFDLIGKVTRNFLESAGLDDETLSDYLLRYQRYLITPINNRLNGIKSLIIAPSDILNFIPFEALKTFDGKYLVEKYNIRYLHSTSILLQLQQRQYDPSRKPLLAMGGAIYQDMETETIPLSSVEKLNELRLEAEESIRSGKSLRKAYGSLFGTRAMNPLLGTGEEVKAISKNLSGADVFLGQEMTENRLKMMSNSGALKNYKILHLATHGFVVSEVPDLSGVAMCIFPREQEGEDGFLNSVEIANLKLNADLTVLSACQTALGQLYVGEGVSGLTQSIFLAGSNAALVSLWPVDDTSTMLFMSNFYKEVAKGKPYPQIVNELKRKFIKGEFGKEFQHPKFWAPFIYYGR